MIVPDVTDPETAPQQTDRKRCSTCRRMRPISAFWRNRSVPDGLSGYCKECGEVHRARSRARKRNDRRQLQMASLYRTLRNARHVQEAVNQALGSLGVTSVGELLADSVKHAQTTTERCRYLEVVGRLALAGLEAERITAEQIRAWRTLTEAD